MKSLCRISLAFAFMVFLIVAPLSSRAAQEKIPRPVSVLILLGEWFGDAYFPLKAEIEARGWTMKRIGVEAEYRGCYNKKRDVLLTSDILIPDLKDFSGYDCLIIPSGPQFRKFRENPVALQFVRDAYAAGLLIASFCVGNNTVRDTGLIDLPYGPGLFPEKVTMVKERILIGPRGGGPPPGDGFESAPIKEICEAIARELARPSVIVPEGNGQPVLIDGLFSPGEWDDALICPINDRVDLYLKVNSGHLFLGMKYKEAVGVVSDIWMTSDDRTVYQMHSSGQLGETVLSLPVGDNMPETIMGYSKDWDANEIKSDSKKKAEWQAAGRPVEGYRKVLFPSDGKEYQIVLSKFSGRRLKMRLMAGDSKGLTIYPEKSDLKSTDNWLELVLPEKGPRESNDQLSRQQAESQEAEKQKIAQVISSVIGWAKTKDLNLFYGSIANDEDYISVTPTKRIVKRFEDVKQSVPFWMSPDFQYVRHELKDLEIKFARCGEVAWFFCILDDINTYKGQPATWENTRWTGVVEKRDGKWVVVSQHFSFASDN
jgi:ketosteroid isomerase-like protein